MHWYLDVLKKYAVFEGRAGREEFWMFTLLNFIVSFAVGIISGILGIEALSFLYMLGVLIPSLAVMVRRLHDTGKTGWWTLLYFIPILGWIALIIFAVQQGQSGDNTYGPNPKGSVSVATSSSVETPQPVSSIQQNVEEDVLSEKVTINDVPSATAQQEPENDVQSSERLK